MNLHRKTIVDSLVWEVCNQADETAEHIVLDCPFARAFWLRLGFSPAQPTQMNVCSAFSVRAISQLSFTTPSSPFAIGTYGKEGMALFSEMNWLH